MNVAGALTLADSPEQVPLLKAQIIANDEADPQGRLIADVATVSDLLPGTAEEQEAKLAVLDRIRDRLTPAVHRVAPRGRALAGGRAEAPRGLRVLGADDLPPLLRRRFEENDGRVGHGLLREVPERRHALGRAQPAPHREGDGQRPAPRRGRRADGEPRDDLRRDAPVDGEGRPPRVARLARCRRARRAGGDAQRARRAGGPHGAPARGDVDGRRRGVVRREAQLRQLRHAPDHLRHRLRVPVQRVRPLAPARGRRLRGRAARRWRRGPLQLHDRRRLRGAHLRGLPGAAIVRPAGGQRRDRVPDGGARSSCRRCCTSSGAGRAYSQTAVVPEVLAESAANPD